MKKRCYKKKTKIKRIIASSLIIILSLYVLPNSVSANILFNELENQQEKEISKRDEESVEVPKGEQPSIEAPKEKDEESVEVSKEEQPSVEAPKEKDEESVEVPKEEQPSVEAPKEKDEESVEIPKEGEPSVEAPKEKDEENVEVPKEGEPSVEVPKEKDEESVEVSKADLYSVIIPSDDKITGTLNLETGVVTGIGINSTGRISEGGTYKISGKSATTQIIVEKNADVILDNVEQSSRMILRGGAELNLYLVGNSVLKGGINVQGGTIINILGGEKGREKLDLGAYYTTSSLGGDQSGTTGTINITGGIITADASMAAGQGGIGGGGYGSRGDITIGGTANVTAFGGQSSAAIGDGSHASTSQYKGKITIEGNAKVTAYSGVAAGYGIGRAYQQYPDGRYGEIEMLGNCEVVIICREGAGGYYSTTGLGGVGESILIDKTASLEIYGYKNESILSNGDFSKSEANIVGYMMRESFSYIDDKTLILKEVGNEIETEFVVPKNCASFTKSVPKEGEYTIQTKELDGKIIFNADNNKAFSSKSIAKALPILTRLGVLLDPNAEIHGADDKTIRVGQVDAFNLNLLDGVTVTDYKTNPNDILVPKVTGTVGKPLNVTKTYNLTYTVTDKGNNITTKVRKITVIGTNSPPTISGLTPITIVEGTSFDIKSGVTANDLEEGDITAKLVYPKDDLRALTNGSHEIEYSVEDGDGNIIRENRKVEVRAILDQIIIPSGITLIEDASGVAIKEEKITLILDPLNPLDRTLEIKTNPMVEVEFDKDKVEIGVFNELGNKILPDRLLGEINAVKPEQVFTLKVPLRSFKKDGIYNGNITFEIEYKKTP